MEGRTLDRPLPEWLRYAHETYQIGQACPWWRPEPDEVTDFTLQAMARIHAIYEHRRTRALAEQIARVINGGQ